MTKPKLTASELAQFIGSQQWYRHPFVRNVLYTEGAKYLAERGSAYWLIDEIAFGQSEPRVAAEDFQHWVLRVDEEQRSAMLACDDGNGRVVFNKEIAFTDFPLPEIALYFCGGTILLPSEY